MNDWQRTVKTALDAKNVNNECPACNHGVWGVVAERLGIGPIGTVGGGKPLIGLVCANCGYLSLHMAERLGL